MNTYIQSFSNCSKRTTFIEEDKNKVMPIEQCGYMEVCSKCKEEAEKMFKEDLVFLSKNLPATWAD
jgi:hypothetical protein